MGPTQRKTLPVLPPIEAPELNDPYRAKEVRSDLVPLCMVIFNGKVTVWPGVQEVHAGASIATLTISRSLEVQGFLFEISQLNWEFPTVCANALVDKSKVKNKKTGISSFLIMLFRGMNKLVMILLVLVIW